MTLQLIKETDPILRNVAEPWDFSIDGDPSEFVRNMAKLMMENNGIGLAAPQVGVSKRIFVMGNSDKLVAVINPEILEGSGQIMDKEGCLSFPDLWLNVKRYEKIKVKFTTSFGKTIETEFSDLMARVFQHEYDHLEGICYDTRVGKVSLELARNRRKKRSGKSFY